MEAAGGYGVAFVILVSASVGGPKVASSSMYASRASRSLPIVSTFWPSLRAVKLSPPLAIKLLTATR